jgi:hypothetical protein
MSLIPCDFCHRRVPEKLSSVTWAWYRVDGQRTAYRQRLCTACFCQNLLPLDKDADFDDLRCPACGISVNTDMDPCYATAFIPGSGRKQFELPTCAACAVPLRVRAQEGATHLEDSKPVEGPATGPSTVTTRESYWEAVGIIPREPAR